MSTEAKFVVSHNFTTIRGDSYDEFISNLTAVYGEEDAKSLAAVAFSELRNHYLGVPSEREAQEALQKGLGAVQAPPVANPQRSQAPSGDWIALDVPYAQKDYVKANGAKFNSNKKAWTVPPGHPLATQFPVKQ